MDSKVQNLYALEIPFPDISCLSRQRENQFGEERMRKFTLLLTSIVILMILSHPAYSQKLKAGGSLNYYTVTDSLYKDVYGAGNIMFGGSLSYEVLKSLELRAEASYFKQKGEMTLSQEEITLTLIPLILGARVYFFEFNPLTIYLGTGMDFYAYKEKLPDRFEEVSESTIGYHLEAGSYVNIWRKVYLDMNFRYIKADAKPFDETINLGGFRAGIGIGFQF
jgi:opacity protein-like surface antigen